MDYFKYWDNMHGQVAMYEVACAGGTRSRKPRDLTYGVAQPTPVQPKKRGKKKQKKENKKKKKKKETRAAKAMAKAMAKATAKVSLKSAIRKRPPTKKGQQAKRTVVKHVRFQDAAELMDVDGFDIVAAATAMAAMSFTA